MNYSQIFKKNWEIPAICIALMVVLALILTVIMPFLYRSTVQILVIQKQVENLDAYTANKSAERIAKNLSQVIFASTFYTQIIDSQADIKSLFPTDKNDLRKEWKKIVEAQVQPETGILSISAFSQDKNRSALLAQTIADTLVAKAAEYHGGGNEVETKIIDEVFTSRYPVRPNILLNLAISILFGLIVGNIIMLFWAEKQKEPVFNLEDEIDDPFAGELADEVVLNDEEEQIF